MAWIFSMWIEAGESEADGKAMLDFFYKIPILETDDKPYKVFSGNQGDATMVTVDGISRSGIGSEEEAREMSKIGFEFYKLLKTAPAFRYALVGVEVDGFRYWNELVKEPNDILLFNGLVIRKDLYQLLGSPGSLTEFKENYLWRPYKGEIYERG